MKFAVALLLATVAAERPVWGLRSVNDHRTDASVQKEYGDASVAAANARNPQTSSLVQLVERPVWGLRSVNDHRTDATVQKEYGDASVAAANARNPQTSSLLQLESDSSDSDSDDDFVQQRAADFFPRDNGHAGYERKIPVQF